MSEFTNITEKRYKALLNSDDFIAIFTPETVYKYANDSYCNFVRQDADSLIGKKMIDSIPEDKKKLHFNLLAQISPSSPTASALDNSGPAGNERWVLWKKTGLFDDTGDLQEIICIGRDMTDSIELRHEKDKILDTLLAFKQAIDTNIICTITDARGIITYANEKFCSISQFSQEELIGKTHNIVNSGYHTKDFFAGMWKTIMRGNAWAGQIKNKSKHGRYYWVESVIIPIKDKQSKINGFVSLRILIDEQKRLEEERNVYVKSIEDMLFMVSHEIRKSITNCQGLLHLMKDNTSLPKDEYMEYLSYLLTTVAELDNYSRKLNDHIQQNIKGALSLN